MSALDPADKAWQMCSGPSPSLFTYKVGAAAWELHVCSSKRALAWFSSAASSQLPADTASKSRNREPRCALAPSQGVFLLSGVMGNVTTPANCSVSVPPGDTRGNALGNGMYGFQCSVSNDTVDRVRTFTFFGGECAGLATAAWVERDSKGVCTAAAGSSCWVSQASAHAPAVLFLLRRHATCHAPCARHR